MENKNIPHREKVETIPHSEKKARRKYTKRVKHPREIELEKLCEVQRSKIRHLIAKYAHVEAEVLATRAKAVKLRREYYYWVSDDDVVDYCAGVWLCHPTSRMFRLYLSHYGVYTRIQHAMHSGEWADIVAKAHWVREFAGWRHPPADGPYDADSWRARLKQRNPIQVVGGLLKRVNDGAKQVAYG
jgi:hypothetical protein